MRILVVEDNPTLADTIRFGLVEHGYAVHVSLSGFDWEERAVTGDYNVVILDRLLPGRDGISVCRNLRERQVGAPILMLSALAGPTAAFAGLDSGADDFLPKPFEFEELVARVRALSRRGQACQSALLTEENLSLDLHTRTAIRAGIRITLSGKEFAMLEYLMRNPDRVLTQRMIMDHVWDANHESTSNVIDVVISSLRRKVDRRFAPRLIHTVIGAGYRFGTCWLR